MARIQVLELPSVQVGELYQTRFVLVIDQADPALKDATKAPWKPSSPRPARAVLVFQEKVDVA